MLHGEGFEPDEGTFWTSYFLKAFPRADREDLDELYELEDGLVGEDEADDLQRGLWIWEGDWGY